MLGSEYNVLERLELPAVPVGDSELATGGVLALAIVVVGTLIAAVAGGKSGERYHRGSIAPDTRPDGAGHNGGSLESDHSGRRAW